MTSSRFGGSLGGLALVALLGGCVSIAQLEAKIQRQRAAGQIQECVKTGEHALAHKLSSDFIQWNLARCYLRADKHKEAMEAVSRIERKFPEKHALKAAVFAAAGDSSKAVDEFEVAVKAGLDKGDDLLTPSLVRALGTAGQRGMLATALFVVNRAGDFGADLELFKAQQTWTWATLESSTRVPTDKPVYVLARVQPARIEVSQEHKATMAYGDEWIAVQQVAGVEKKLKRHTVRTAARGTEWMGGNELTVEAEVTEAVFKPTMQHTGITSMLKFDGVHSELSIRSGYVILAKLAGTSPATSGQRQSTLPMLEVLQHWEVPALVVPPEATRPTHDQTPPAKERPAFPNTW